MPNLVYAKFFLRLPDFATAIFNVQYFSVILRMPNFACAQLCLPATPVNIMYCTVHSNRFNFSCPIC